MKIQLILISYFPSRACKGTISTMVWAREGGERAPVALCREPVSAPASVGAERSPPATSARAGRRDGGGLTIAFPLAGETRGWAAQSLLADSCPARVTPPGRCRTSGSPFRGRSRALGGRGPGPGLPPGGAGPGRPGRRTGASAGTGRRS